MSRIQWEQVTFRYPGSDRNAIDNVTLTVPSGAFCLLCGKSGCGKTTLLQQLKPAITPHGTRTGQVTLSGTPVDGLSFRDQSTRIGYVMQDTDSQLVTDQVWHELAFGLENLGLDQQTIRLRVAEMAQFFGLQDLFHRDVHTLSGGQKQQVNLAGVMVMQPDVLVLDEPTAQLDPVSAGAFFQMLRRINQELGVTVILSEHRLEQLYATVDQVVVLSDGKLHANGTPEQVARQLMAEQSDLLPMLPAPVQISSAVTGGAECPMTVRAGRLWLEQWAEGRAVPPVKERKTPESENNEPVLELKDVWYRYDKDGKDVLRGVTFTVTQGSFCALTGGNGSGKSTLLKSICGLCKPYRGWVKVQGKKLGKYGKGELFQQRRAAKGGPGQGAAPPAQNPAAGRAHQRAGRLLQGTAGTVAAALPVGGRHHPDGQPRRGVLRPLCHPRRPVLRRGRDGGAAGGAVLRRKPVLHHRGGAHEPDGIPRRGDK